MFALLLTACGGGSPETQTLDLSSKYDSIFKANSRPKLGGDTMPQIGRIAPQAPQIALEEGKLVVDLGQVTMSQSGAETKSMVLSVNFKNGEISSYKLTTSASNSDDPPPPKSKVIVVKRLDTVERIAARNGVDPSCVHAANPLKVGQRITIKCD